MTQREHIISHFSSEQCARLLDLPNSYPPRYMPADMPKLTQAAQTKMEAAQ